MGFEVGPTIDYIYNYIVSQGYTYEKLLIKNLYISLKTKPFVILSGISGTGKSKIVELFAKSLGATAENKRFNLVPVKPDWSDSTDLLGFRNISKLSHTSLAKGSDSCVNLPGISCLISNRPGK